MKQADVYSIEFEGCDDKTFYFSKGRCRIGIEGYYGLEFLRWLIREQRKNEEQAIYKKVNGEVGCNDR